MAEHATVSVSINGEQHTLDVDTRTSLLDLLREHLGLTGAKKGCDQGQCGACTVLLDRRRANACLALAVAHDGAEVITVEGLADNGSLTPLQTAFVEHDAFQCGYCTSGMIMAAVGLLKTNPNPSEQDIARLMDRSVCRCGTYPRIVKAVRMAAERMRTSSSMIGGK